MRQASSRSAFASHLRTTYAENGARQLRRVRRESLREAARRRDQQRDAQHAHLRRGAARGRRER